ncbi:MAG: hypothetical protein WC875_00600 [Candidatus Absconditabacterales bacterium]
MKKDETLIIQELKKAGYTIKEIERILQGLNDIDKNKLFSTEEVYKHLLANHKVYV